MTQITTPAPVQQSGSSVPQSKATFLVVALWCGVISGFAEVFYHLMQRRLGWCFFLRQSPDFVWMAPLTDALVFAIPGLLLAALSFRALTPKRLMIGVGILMVLFFARLLMIYGRLESYAVALLAVGLGVQCTRMLVPRWPHVYPVICRTLALTVFLVALLAASRYALKAQAAQQELAALPAPPKDVPNVLFITLDTVRAENMSLYGYARRTTPHLERWAQRGTAFSKAFVPAPWTLPSHASMFTGRYPQEMTATWSMPLDNRHPTLAETLRDQGYVTAGFVANRYYAGFDSGLSRGFIHYEDYKVCAGECIMSSAFTRWLCHRKEFRQATSSFDLYGRKNAAEVNSSFLGWLSGHDKQRPFFAFLNYFDAHDPYLPPAPFDALFGPAPTLADKSHPADCGNCSSFTRWLANRSECDKTLLARWWLTELPDVPKKQLDMAVQQYDGAIAYLDDQVNRLLNDLDQRGILDNTLVVITSDHGEHFGEHDQFIHGNSLYRSLLNVPLLMIYPKKVPAGKTVDDYVTIRDVAATVLDVSGVQNRSKIPGNSLAGQWDDTASGKYSPSPIFAVGFTIPSGHMRPDHGRSPVASGSLLSLIDDGKCYIKHLSKGTEEVYDHTRDPRELTNLADSKEHAELLLHLRARVKTVFEQHPSIFSDYP